MHGNVDERVCRLAEWIIENKATVRAAAERFGVSKSTVHKDLTERLRQLDRLYPGRERHETKIQPSKAVKKSGERLI